jgi:hypothetical protein
MFRLACVLLSVAAPLAFSNVVANPSFESGAGSTSGSNLNNIPSPAPGWSGWNNTATTTLLEILPTTLPLPDAGSQMIHISSAGAGNGLYQFFGGGSDYVGGWFYVNSGSAHFLLGQGSSFFSSDTTHQGQWEFVGSSTPVSANELAIYTGSGGGDFFADLISVDSSPITPEQIAPEPASAALAAAAGLLITALRLRRRV